MPGRAVSVSVQIAAFGRSACRKNAALAARSCVPLPSPISHRLPRIVIRCTHWRDPFGCTRRYSPCPSKYLPGSFTVSTKRGESAFCGLRIALSAIIPVPLFVPHLNRDCAGICRKVRDNERENMFYIKGFYGPLRNSPELPMAVPRPPFSPKTRPAAPSGRRVAEAPAAIRAGHRDPAAQTREFRSKFGQICME